jgi:hypothetical protein
MLFCDEFTHSDQRIDDKPVVIRINLRDTWLNFLYSTIAGYSDLMTTKKDSSLNDSLEAYTGGMTLLGCNGMRRWTSGCLGFIYKPNLCMFIMPVTLLAGHHIIGLILPLASLNSAVL